MSGRYEAVLGVVKRLKTVTGDNPCKKTVQKIIYLIEEAGEPLGYNYSIHFYGPYSADLDYDIQYQSILGNLEIDYTDYGHLLSVVSSEKAANMSDKAIEVIETFGTKTPSELELLATTLFVQRKVSSIEPENILPTVKRIKGKKYSDSQINNAVQVLHESHYF